MGLSVEFGSACSFLRRWPRIGIGTCLKWAHAIPNQRWWYSWLDFRGRVYGQSRVDRQSPVAYKEPHFRGESIWSGTPPRRPHQMRLWGCDCRMALISGQIRTAAPRASPRLICQGHPRPAMPMFHAQTLIWCMRACVHARMQELMCPTDKLRAKGPT